MKSAQHLNHQRAHSQPGQTTFKHPPVPYKTIRATENNNHNTWKSIKTGYDREYNKPLDPFGPTLSGPFDPLDPLDPFDPFDPFDPTFSGPGTTAGPLPVGDMQPGARYCAL